MLDRLPIDLIVKIGILTGPDEYEQIAKTSKRNAIILQKPYIIKATNELLVKVTLIDRTMFMYQNLYHSFNDQPSLSRLDGMQVWHQHGKRHRDYDLPAAIWADGTQYWYQHGKIHRDNDQPSIIHSDGTEQWHQHGFRHRDNDQPAVIHADGSKEWYQHGERIK
jgi:hypothetical protein